MSKLPNIFHNNDKFFTNNKNSFSTFDKEKENIINENKERKKSLIDEEIFINYFNQNVVITLNDGSIYSGVLLSKRDNNILLDSNDVISMKDIAKIN